MTSTAEDRSRGDMVLAVLDEGAAGTASWETLEELAKGLTAPKTLAQWPKRGPSPAGQTIDGASAVPFTLQPHQPGASRWS